MTWIEHPDLPGRKVEVADMSVPHYRAAGWAVTTPPAKREKPADDGEPTATADVPTDDDAAEDAAETKTEPPKRRRASTKED